MKVSLKAPSMGGANAHALKVILSLGFFCMPLLASHKAHADDADPDEAALLSACEIEKAPSGQPLDKNGNVNERWKWVDSNKKVWNQKFKTSEDKNVAFKNAICENYILKHIAAQSGKDDAKERCVSIRNDLYFANAEAESGTNTKSSDSSLTAADSFLKSSRGKGNDDGDEKLNACEDDNNDPEVEYACQYMHISKEFEKNGTANRAAAKSVASYCASIGADMTAHVTAKEYASRTGAGIDYEGNGFCGERSASGSIVIDNNNNFKTAANLTLGLAKVLAPIAAMTYTSYLHEKNDDKNCNRAYKLGFPCSTNAGSIAGGGIYAGGHGGGIYGGGAYSGYSGGCPYGACQGNGGYIVGGGIAAGGFAGGGGCAIPPYVGSYSGCGGGGVIQGGGYNGSIGAGANCYPAGAGGNYGGVFGGGGGYGVGGGYGGGGAGGGYYGPGYQGGLGGPGGFPGPYGTGDGSNGWGQGGNPFGSNGAYGGPQQYGASNPYNSQYMAAYAKMYEEYAASISRKASQASQLTKLYEKQQKISQDDYDKSYKTYLAIQMAQWGMGQGGGLPGMGGGYGVGGGSSYGGQTGVYYPPMSSGGSNFSVGGGFNYSSSQ